MKPIVLAQCIGKVAFSTPQLANKVKRRRGTRGRGEKREQEVYRCDNCGLFHIGRPVRLKLDPKPRRQREDETEMV